MVAAWGYRERRNRRVEWVGEAGCHLRAQSRQVAGNLKTAQGWGLLT